MYGQTNAIADYPYIGICAHHVLGIVGQTRIKSCCQVALGFIHLGQIFDRNGSIKGIPLGGGANGNRTLQLILCLVESTHSKIQFPQRISRDRSGSIGFSISVELDLKGLTVQLFCADMVTLVAELLSLVVELNGFLERHAGHGLAMGCEGVNVNVHDALVSLGDSSK